MSVATQRHQPIALADILLDEDQSAPQSGLAVPSFDRMPMQVDMPSSRYWSTHRQDNLPGTCPGGSPNTAAYQDAVPFTTVSSFNFPATADSTLLTPISNAGSPPLRQRPSTNSAMRAYHHSHHSSSAQQPTPPNTSTGVYYPGYELSSSSQSPSPLTVQPHPTEYAMASYMRQSPDIHGHPSSPKDDGPPPQNHTYFGSYTVSGGCSGYTDFPSGLGPGDSTFITQGPGGSMPSMQPIITTGGPGIPILERPSPALYRDRVEDIYGQPNYQPSLRTPRQHPRGVSKRPPRQRKISSRPLEDKPRRVMDEVSHNNHTEPLGNGEEAVTLSGKCEEEARFIFETRKALVESGMKGKGMWEEISRKYEEVYGQRLEKATLQMRLTRTFAKHAIWPEKELERLKEAYEYVEQRRYKLILARMREVGGGQCWNWTPQLIEAKLIDLGFEEPNMDEKTKTRKRRRQARHRRVAAAQQNQALLHGDGQHWASGLGLDPGVMQAAVQHHQHHHHQEGSEDPDDMMPHYTAQQREQYLDEIVSKIKDEQEDSSPEPDVLDVAYNGSGDNGDQSHQQNARVAKRAVDHLMLNQISM